MKDLTEDLYDGQVLQKLFGENLNPHRIWLDYFSVPNHTSFHVILKFVFYLFSVSKDSD